MSTFSQHSFFIRPSTNNKIVFNTKNKNAIIECGDGSKIFYYADIKNLANNYTEKDFGVTIGYIFKKYVFESGILFDQSRFSGRVLSLIPVQGAKNNKKYQTHRLWENSGIDILRIPLRLYYNNVNNKVLKSNITTSFFIGLDVLTPSFDSWGKSPVLDLWSKDIQTPYSKEIIKYQYGPYHKNVVTFSPSIGFMIKFRYKNGLEICNIHFDWYFDEFKEMGGHKAIFTSSGGLNVTINNKLSSQGFVFKISRDFIFFKKQKTIVSKN